MTAETRPQYSYHRSPATSPTKASLKAWWHQFAFVQRVKKSAVTEPFRGASAIGDHLVFGKPLKDSLQYASVQISTANAKGELYVWGYIPVVVAKCGLYLKENATEVEGTFRINGSVKRMRQLQVLFETPPRFGKSLDWKQNVYTTHDVASVFRRYLTQMPEPVIPYDMYHQFRDALGTPSSSQESIITQYKYLIRQLPCHNQYLLLYVLDLLSVFARRSDRNLMTPTNLAVIFRPGLIAHPQHEMMPHEHVRSQRVLEFLIAQQDWFLLEIQPPQAATGIGTGTDMEFQMDQADDVQTRGGDREGEWGQREKENGTEKVQAEAGGSSPGNVGLQPPTLTTRALGLSSPIQELPLSASSMLPGLGAHSRNAGAGAEIEGSLHAQGRVQASLPRSATRQAVGFVTPPRSTEIEDVMIVPTADMMNTPISGGWKLIERGIDLREFDPANVRREKETQGEKQARIRAIRRRTTLERTDPDGYGVQREIMPILHQVPIVGGKGVVRSHTLPSSRREVSQAGDGATQEVRKRVLRKPKPGAASRRT